MKNEAENELDELARTSHDQYASADFHVNDVTDAGQGDGPDEASTDEARNQPIGHELRRSNRTT